MRTVIFAAADRPQMERALAVRFAVFVDEQRVPGEIEVDEHDMQDPRAAHVLVIDDDETPIAAGRLYERDVAVVQIGRMAVLGPYRGRGIGALLLDTLMAEARRRGYVRAVLHAQTHAKGFYEKAGFIAHGDAFDDAGIEHIEMTKALDS